MGKERVLILCTGNSARSQMAEGLLRHDAGGRFEVESAGTKPGQVRPEAVAVMKELGIEEFHMPFRPPSSGWRRTRASSQAARATISRTAPCRCATLSRSAAN